MFENLGWPEIIGLLLVALFILGPERLPKVIGDVLRGLRKLRQMARNATSDLSRELGTDVRLEDLHPKTFLRKHILSEEEEARLRRPIESLYSDVRDIAQEADLNQADLNKTTDGSPQSLPNGHKSAKFDADAT
ncbi:MAG TPA: Sec-independent protein translocase subunit TatB [Micromonosporaceae bacterium]